jgi:hypothetical protein
VRLFRGEVALLRHEREHEIAPRARGIGVARWIVERGPLGERGERGRFHEGELRRGMAEVVARRRVDAVPVVAEVDLIEIRLEDLRLAVVRLHLARRGLLAELARDRLVAAVHEIGMHVAHQLLRDRARAARVAADRVLECAGDADEVDAIMDVEALILDRDEGLADIQRQARERNAGPPLRPDLAEEGTLAAQDEGGLRRGDDLPGFAGRLRVGRCRHGRSGDEEGERKSRGDYHG